MSRGSLRTPLDDILGARANVQILRVLTRHQGPLGRSEASRRANLTRAGGLKAIDRLYAVGIIDVTGSGRTQQIRLRKEHPLASDLVDLFQAEAVRHEDLIEALKSRIAELRPPPGAAWIEGPVARETDEYGDPLVLGLLADAGEVDDLAEELRDLLVGEERRFDVTIEVRPRTRADLSAVHRASSVTLPLMGPAPTAFISDGELEGSRVRRHEDHDQAALERARRLSEMLVREPTLRDRALVWLEERLTEDEANREYREWRRILESASIPRLRRLLTSEDQRAVRLRQSLPFWPILTNEERAEILAESNDDS